jgi:hypothetical protein
LMRPERTPAEPDEPARPGIDQNFKMPPKDRVV